MRAERGTLYILRNCAQKFRRKKQKAGFEILMSNDLRKHSMIGEGGKTCVIKRVQVKKEIYTSSCIYIAGIFSHVSFPGGPFPVCRYPADKIDSEAALAEGTSAVREDTAAEDPAIRNPGFRNRNSADRGSASPAARIRTRTGLFRALAAAGSVHSDYRAWFSGPAFPHRRPETF